MAEIVTRAQAKSVGLARYFTGQPCKHGHIAERKVSNAGCLECHRVRSNDAYYADHEANKLKNSEFQRKYRLEDPERVRSRNRANSRKRYHSDAEYREKVLKACKHWQAMNAEKASETNRRYYRLNRERLLNYQATYRIEHKEKFRACIRRHYASNQPLYNFYALRRNAALKRARPAWVNTDDLVAAYDERDRLNATTGLPHEVDHIIPLQGENVSGLHVPWNLQVLPRELNRAKGNRFEEETANG